MKLPEYVSHCICLLEAAGYAAYAVGGCVRDSVLGLIPHDYDLCTCATPNQIRQVFADHRLVLAGEKHGTVSVVIDGALVEITTFRTEGGYTDSRHPDWVRFVTDIEEDLSRRDFTVNAMAYSPTRGFADPFGGKEDLKDHILRTVGDPAARFREDALRILRGVRFAVGYSLTPEEQTGQAMTALAPLMGNLARERVFEELSKLLPLVTAGDLLRFQPILTQVIPELGASVGFQQHNPHHIHDIYTHAAYTVQAVPPKLHLRLAALLHDIGKPSTFYLDETGCGHFPGHAKAGAEMANGVLLRLKAPTALRKQVVDLIQRHMTPLEPNKHILRRRLSKYGIEGTQDLLALQRADFESTATAEDCGAFDRISGLIDEILAEDSCLSIKDLAIDGKDLLALGFAPDRKLGICLETLLSQVQEEVLPNTKTALLEAAEIILREDIL